MGTPIPGVSVCSSIIRRNGLEGHRPTAAQKNVLGNAMISITVNGKAHRLDIEPETPLLWVIRDELGLTGTKFGCGVALCGACTVHVDGRPIRSCITPVASIADKAITTIEAIGETPSGKKIQQAWLSLEVVQCGYCQPGQIM